MTLSLGAATDYLVTQAQAASAGITVSGRPIVVADGEPSVLEPGMFVVGLSHPTPEGETSGTRTWQGLGGRRLEEDYTVPCYIDVRIAGTSQKTARDLATSIFDAFWALIVTDLTLGGALKGGRFAEIDDLTATPANLGTVAEPGRRQLLSFGVRCRSLTT